jgi:uncharacterized protein
MGQLLRIIVILIGLWLVLKIIKRALVSGKTGASRQPSISKMVACDRCGVHIPETEAVQDGSKHYCCEEHRDVARKR